MYTVIFKIRVRLGAECNSGLQGMWCIIWCPIENYATAESQFYCHSLTPDESVDKSLPCGGLCCVGVVYCSPSAEVSQVLL